MRPCMRWTEGHVVDAPATVPVIDVVHAAVGCRLDGWFPRHTHVRTLTPTADRCARDRKTAACLRSNRSNGPLAARARQDNLILVQPGAITQQHQPA